MNSLKVLEKFEGEADKFNDASNRYYEQGKKLYKQFKESIFRENPKFNGFIIVDKNNYNDGDSSTRDVYTLLSWEDITDNGLEDQLEGKENFNKEMSNDDLCVIGENLRKFIKIIKRERETGYLLTVSYKDGKIVESEDEYYN